MNYISKPLEFLLENGLIFEFNRRVLHPVGLGLEIDVRKNEDDQEETYLKLWSCPKDDPEGFIFPPDAFQLGGEKLTKFMDSRGNECKERRQNVLGYIEQRDDHDESKS